MYRCERCNDNVRGACNKVVTQTRPVTYYRMVDNRKEVSGVGTEIATEEKLCLECAASATQGVVEPKITVFIVPKAKVERPEPAEYEGKESRRKRAA